MTILSATKLRENLYKILDEVIETGVPALVDRKGRRIRIVVDELTGKLDRLQVHDVIVGDPEELVHMDWSGSWSGELPS